MRDHTANAWPLPDCKSGVPDSPTSWSEASTIVEQKSERLSPDITSPQLARDWSPWRKVWATAGAIVSFLVMWVYPPCVQLATEPTGNSTMATSVYIASIPGIMAEFNVGKTLAISPITFYAFGFTIGPMLQFSRGERPAPNNVFYHNVLWWCTLVCPHLLLIR